jgi:hypothetical protein
VIQRARARVSQVLSLALSWIGAISPRAAFRACDALGIVWAITSRRPRPSDLRALFPDLPHHEHGRVLRRIWTSHARTVFLSGWVRREGLTPIRKLVRENPAVRALKAPMIVGTFHIGPTLGLGALSERLQGQTLVLRGTQFPLDRTGQENAMLLQGTDQHRAAMFHRAIERLRTSGFVLMALDPREAQRIAVPFSAERCISLAVRSRWRVSRVRRSSRWWRGGKGTRSS